MPLTTNRKLTIALGVGGALAAIAGAALTAGGRGVGLVALVLALLAATLALSTRRSGARGVASRLGVEEALRASEERFHAIFDQTFQLAFLLSPTGALVEVNETALDFAGTTRDATIGEPFWEFPTWAARERELVRAAVAAAAEGALVRFEAEARGGDGRTAILDMSFKPMHDAAGRVVMVIPEGRDITERKAAEAALRESEAKFSRLYDDARHAARARDELLGVVSHDLRNPLSTIGMCARALLDPQPAPADGIRAMAEIIQHSTEWMQRIIRDLLDVASIEAGRLALDRHAVATADVLDAARELTMVQAANARLELSIDHGESLPPIDADRERVLQVLLNLLGNALKFTRPGGRVTLAAAAETCRDAPPDARADRVRFSVGDTGPGIPPEHLPHVFDRFWQVHATGRAGAGLGLAIAKGIVEAHGGELEVASAVGVGTTFSFTIPVARPAATAPPDAAGPDAPGVTQSVARG